MTYDRNTFEASESRRATLRSAGEELAHAIARGGGLQLGQATPFAMRHLSHLTGLVDAGSHPAFLFACWRQWSAALTPARRVAIARTVSRDAAGAVRTAAGLALPAWLAPAWERYREVTAGCAGPANGALMPYLIFEHAGHALRRVGVEDEESARVALLLRAALQPGGDRGAEPATVALRLQPV